MSKTKTLKVEVLDDDLLKLLIDKMSNLQSQITTLNNQVQMLEFESKVEYPEIFNRKLDSIGVAQ